MNPNSLANLRPSVKGMTNNPLGNYTGTRHRDAEVRKWTSVESEFENPITKQKERMTVRDAMILSMIGAVIIKQNVQAYNALTDDEFGKLTDKIDAQGNIKIEIEYV